MPQPSPGRRALDADPAVIGARVRSLREERGISLSALARLAGVGKATLSGLENGTRNPTLETLYAVTAQLGVPLTAVLAEPATTPTVHGAAVHATLLEVFTDADATYELYRMRVAPGAGQLSPPTSPASPSTSRSSPGCCAPARRTRRRPPRRADTCVSPRTCRTATRPWATRRSTRACCCATRAADRPRR